MRKITPALVVLALAVTACDENATKTPRANPSTTTEPVIVAVENPPAEGSRDRGPATLKASASSPYSSAVVLATATGARREVSMTGEVEFVLTWVKVDEVLEGTVGGASTIEVRQEVRDDGTTSPLRADVRYLLFLQEWGDPGFDGGRTTQVVVGSFRETRADTFVPNDALSHVPVPDQLTLAELKQQVRLTGPAQP